MRVMSEVLGKRALRGLGKSHRVKVTVHERHEKTRKGFDSSGVWMSCHANGMKSGVGYG